MFLRFCKERSLILSRTNEKGERNANRNPKSILKITFKCTQFLLQIQWNVTIPSSLLLLLLDETRHSLGNTAPRWAYCEISRDVWAKIIEKKGKRKRRVSCQQFKGVTRRSSSYLPAGLSGISQPQLWTTYGYLRHNVLKQVTTEVILYPSPQCRV